MISILVILSVILMVGLAVYWMTPPDPGPRYRFICHPIPLLPPPSFLIHTFNSALTQFMFLDSDFIFICIFLHKFQADHFTPHYTLQCPTNTSLQGWASIFIFIIKHKSSCISGLKQNEFFNALLVSVVDALYLLLLKSIFCYQQYFNS